MVQWTNEQRQAIETRNKNLLISAGAGSGKTAVLTERIVRLILEDGVDADRFVVMTFTKAAAAEMKSRVRKALYDRLRLCEDKQAGYRQIELLEQAQISTIHSFCLSLIKSYYYAIDIDPLASMLSESEADLLQDESLEELFEMRYEEGNEAFLQLADIYSQGNDDQALKDVIITMSRFASNRPNPEHWLRSALQYFHLEEDSVEQHPAIDFFMRYVDEMIEDAYNAVERALDLCASYDEDPKKKRTVYLTDLIEQLAIVRQSIGFDARIEAIRSFTIKRYDIRTPCEASEAIKTLRARAKELMDQCKKFFGFTPQTYRRQMQEVSAFLDTLVTACQDYMRIFSAKKLEKTAMDYSDLEHYALRILTDETICADVRNRYEYVFVDEYQDTNAIQEAIINAVVRKNNFFGVGDIKQSIYRFRGAEPEIFTQRYESYMQSSQKNSELIFLNQNFRSEPNIIHAINQIFAKVMYRETCGVDYEPNEALRVGCETRNQFRAQLHIIESDTPEPEEQFERTTYSRYEVEADYTAAIVEDLLTKEIDDGAGLRTIRPSDIAIIGRSLKAKAEIYSDALKRRGIMTQSDQGNHYYDEVEVALVIDLLRVIDNIRNDIPLLGVMRSFLFRFTPDEMIAIRQQCRQALYFYEALFEYQQTGSDEALREKITAMIELVAHYREWSRHISIEKLLRTIYEDFQMPAYVGALPNGPQRRQHLNYLLKLASSYERATFHGLYHFIRFVESSRKRQSVVNTPTAHEDAERVTLMTVHKSKGLEFPVVIFVGCADSFSTMDRKADLILHKSFGICPTFYDTKRLCYTDTIVKTAAKKQIQREVTAEEMRILYVGMTRAKHQLILVGTIQSGEIEKRIERIAADKRDIAESNSYLTWLLTALLEEHTPEQVNGLQNGAWEMFHRTWYPDMTASVLSQGKAVTHPNEDSLQDVESIRELLRYRYLYEQETRIPSKLSVTQLKNEEVLTFDQRVIALTESPRFGSEDAKLTPAQIGTLSHRVLALLDRKALRETLMIESIDQQITWMKDFGIFSEEETEYINREHILFFLRSELGKKFLAANTVHRESSFIMQCPASMIHEQWRDVETPVLVQGVIDCWFDYEGQRYLLDYKTDHRYDESHYQELVASYRKQIELYDLALCESYGKKASRKVICFLSMQRYEFITD